MYPLFENLTQKQADICALVLSASGVPYRIVKNGRRWDIRVAAVDYDRARAAMEQYFAENRSFRQEIDAAPIRIGQNTIVSCVVVCFVLLAVHWQVPHPVESREMVNRFGASAVKIFDGEYFRAVTALMLHADDAHLLGNIFGLFIFGMAVCADCGWGVGWLMVLVSGAGGNLFNAWMYESAHVSIGASTAVFGAVGILAGYQGVRYRGRPGKIKQVLVPVGCGFALLGLLGSGGGDADVRVDIMAHLFGFFAGLLIGAGYGTLVKKTPGNFFQWLCAAGMSGIVCWAWWAG
jgi:membrane associated rhomboid family serine protease